jgi:hypothetical protein
MKFCGKTEQLIYLMMLNFTDEIINYICYLWQKFICQKNTDNSSEQTSPCFSKSQLNC